MALDWTLYDKLLGVNGQPLDPRASAIEGAVSIFADGITDDPAYQKDAVVDGENIPIIAARTSTTECSIKSIPGTDIHIGDMVECLGEHWIVVELYADKVGIINGKMWLCNNAIKFQNHSPAVNTRFCVVDDGTYSKKSSDPEAFVMANTYKVYITIDSATERIYVDKRLAFGEIYSHNGDKVLEVYKVIGMDIKSQNFGEGSHLMVLTVQRDVYDAEADSIEDNICDIYVADDPMSIPTPTGSCMISGKNSARIGTTRKYTVAFVDANGVVVEGVEALWHVICPDGVSFVSDANECIITIPLDSNLVGEDIVIYATDKDEQYGVFEKKVQVITVG